MLLPFPSSLRKGRYLKVTEKSKARRHAMGTEYFSVKFPVTGLKLTEVIPSKSFNLEIWIMHKYAGELTLNESELVDTLLLFADKNDVVYHSYYAGEKYGKITERKKYTGKKLVISGEGKLVKVNDLEKEVEKSKERLRE